MTRDELNLLVDQSTTRHYVVQLVQDVTSSAAPVGAVPSWHARAIIPRGTVLRVGVTTRKSPAGIVQRFAALLDDGSPNSPSIPAHAPLYARLLAVAEPAPRTMRTLMIAHGIMDTEALLKILLASGQLQIDDLEWAIEEQQKLAGPQRQAIDEFCGYPRGSRW